MCTVTEYRVIDCPRTEVSAVLAMCPDPSCSLAKEILLQAFRQGMFNEMPDPTKLDKDKMDRITVKWAT